MQNFIFIVMLCVLFTISCNISPKTSNNVCHAGSIIPGMTDTDVKSSLGEPQNQTHHENYVVWIYPQVPNIDGQEPYTPESAFPQGVACVVPFDYPCEEVRVFFMQNQNIVCRVEKILHKDPTKTRKSRNKKEEKT